MFEKSKKKKTDTLVFYYKTILKKYQSIIIKNHTSPKNIKSNCIFITFFNIKNSGKLRPITAIIKASQVPRGTHFTINA
jgi:hypothetical protein